MSFYFKIIDITRERFPMTPNISSPNATPAASRATSRASSRFGSRSSSRAVSPNISRDVSPEGSRDSSVRSVDRRRFSTGSKLDSPETPLASGGSGSTMPEIKVNGESVDNAQEDENIEGEGTAGCPVIPISSDVSGSSVARRRRGKDRDNQRDYEKGDTWRHEHGNLASLFKHMHRNRNRRRLERFHSDFVTHTLQNLDPDARNIDNHGMERRQSYKSRRRRFPYPFSHVHFLGHGRHSLRSHPPSDTPPQSPTSHHGHPSVLHLNMHNPFPSLSHISLSDWHTPDTRERPVGVFESQRYLNLETRITLSHTGSTLLNDQYMALFLSLVRQSTEDLVRANAEGLQYVVKWFENVNGDRLKFGWQDFKDILTWFGKGRKRWIERKKAEWEEGIRRNEEIRERLGRALDDFRAVKRCECYL